LRGCRAIETQPGSALRRCGHSASPEMESARTSDGSAGRVQLFRLFLVFEKLSCLFEVEEVSVYDEFIDACVVRYGEDALNGVSPFANSFDEKIDVYHAWQFTGFRFRRAGVSKDQVRVR
jgi:hypothetical protein